MSKGKKLVRHDGYASIDRVEIRAWADDMALVRRLHPNYADFLRDLIHEYAAQIRAKGIGVE